MRLTIGRLILLGTLGVIMFFLVGNIFNITKLNDSIEKVEFINKNVEKPINILLDYKDLITKNRMLTSNWVYIQNNDHDKDDLQTLINETWPYIKDEYTENTELFGEDSIILNNVNIRLDQLIEGTKQNITSKLKDFDSYNDMFISMDAQEFLSSQLVPESDTLKNIIEDLYSKKIAISNELKSEMISGFDNLVKIIISVALIAVVAGLLIAFWLNRMISEPIITLTEVVDTLGKGETPSNINYKRDNEIGDIFLSIKNLIAGINSYTVFATNVGEGKLDAQFEKLGENDVLGTSLIDMRNNLRKVAEEEKKRSWATEGLAKFGDILRQEEDITHLSQSIISNLVKYMNANQGGLFIVYGEGEFQQLDLKASYAYDRQKFLEKSIKKGQGLVGQCWHEGQYIYMTDIPNNYISIGSGLGDSNPTSVLIVPLIYNDEILGIVELASFNTFSDFEIEFILKVGESIAATISTAKVSESTTKLLANTSEMTEQLQSQEEELRQQTEELMATQEESQRQMIEIMKENDKLKKENAELKQQIGS